MSCYDRLRRYLKALDEGKKKESMKDELDEFFKLMLKEIFGT